MREWAMPDPSETNTEQRVMLRADRLSCGYGASAILRDISFEIREAEIFALLGRNGMGKTTLVRTIMGFLPPLGGSVHIRDIDITRQSPPTIVRCGVAYAPQEKAIFQDLSIAENLKLATRSEREFGLSLPIVFELFPF